MHMSQIVKSKTNHASHLYHTLIFQEFFDIRYDKSLYLFANSM